MAKPKQIDLNAILRMSVADQQIELSKLAKRANVRLQSFRKQGLTNSIIKQSEQYIEKYGTKTGKFSESKTVAPENVRLQILEMVKLLTSEQGNIREYKKIVKKRQQSVINTYITPESTPEEVNIVKSWVTNPEFWKFISSETYKHLRLYYDSDQIFNNARFRLNEEQTNTADKLARAWETAIHENTLTANISGVRLY